MSKRTLDVLDALGRRIESQAQRIERLEAALRGAIDGLVALGAPDNLANLIEARAALEDKS